MSQDPADQSESSAFRERLSALMDGQADPAAVARACAQWRDDAAVRSSWHEYHLIGDVLRSDDLSSSARHDARFLNLLRARLATEPVVLAPDAPVQPVGEASPASSIGHGVRAAQPGKVRARWVWAGASAVAAGFVAVVGLVNQVPRGAEVAAVEPAPAAARVVSMDRASPGQGTVSVAQPINVEASYIEPQPLVANGKLIRDARLDRYLSAHQQFAGTTALGVPSAFLRSATAEASNR